MVYILIFRICSVFITELGMPILTFNIYNPNQKIEMYLNGKELK